MRGQGVAALSKRWAEVTGNTVGPTMALQFMGAARSPCCCTFRGVGRCNCDLTESQMQSLTATYDMVRRLAKAAELYQDTLPAESLLPRLAAVHIRPSQGAQELSGFLFLVAAASKKPLFPVLVPCSTDAGGVLPGGLSAGMRFKLDNQAVENGSLNFHGPADVANALHDCGATGWRVDLVSYCFVNLLLCEISAVEEVTDRLDRKGQRPMLAKAQDQDPTLKLIGEVEAEPPEPKAKRYKVKHGAIEVKARKAKQAANQASDSSSSSSCSETQAVESVVEAAAPVGAEPPAPAEVAGDIQEAAAEVLQWDPADFQVRDASGRIVGRVKPLHQGVHGKEAVSCYCRLHACAVPLLGAAQAPPVATYVSWLAKGRELPAGAGSKSAHLSLWRQMLREHRAVPPQ